MPSIAAQLENDIAHALADFDHAPMPVDSIRQSQIANRQCVSTVPPPAARGYAASVPYAPNASQSTRSSGRGGYRGGAAYTGPKGFRRKYHPARDWPKVDEVTITKNVDKNGVEIRFPSKPSEDVLERLRSNGFRFSFAGGFWYAPFSVYRSDLAADIKKNWKGTP